MTARLKSLALALALATLAGPFTRPCTIFVLSDSEHVLFGNNEDWSNPKTRIWFVPGGGRYGRVYLGFDNGWGQGGMNTAGLAFDWNAGYKEKWERDPKLKPVKGNPAERMLESCATVDEAVTFFQTHWEPSFSYAKILIADRTGASVILRARDGKMIVERMTQSRAVGYQGPLAEKMLAEKPSATPEQAARILQAALQEGQYGTKYSNVFDLKTGDIHLYRFPEQSEPIQLNLFAELKKGGHFYDIPKLNEQLRGKLKPLSRLTSK